MGNKCRSDVFVYPKLPSQADLGFFRYRGSGLANCLFIVARAHVLSSNNNWNYINPTWGNIIFGPYLRNEQDKRHYFNLFKDVGVSGLLKLYYINFYKKIKLELALNGMNGLVVVEGLGNYFEEFIHDQEKVKTFIFNILRPENLISIKKENFKNVIGVHIRLGDYSSERRTDLNWYENIIKMITSAYGNKYHFFVFSDGKDDELQNILDLVNTKRVFYGNAISDIVALSKSKLIIGSDSTFSAWSAFIEQVPIVFPKRHFGNVLVDKNKELVSNNDFESIKFFITDILKTNN